MKTIIKNWTIIHYTYRKKLTLVGRGAYCFKGERKKWLSLEKEGKTYQYIQIPLKCTANMSNNAINYEPKPEKRYAIQKTTIIEDVRKVRFSKTYPCASCRTMKADVSLGIRDGTILRSLFDENLNARSPPKEPLLGKRRPKDKLK